MRRKLLVIVGSLSLVAILAALPFMTACAEKPAPAPTLAPPEPIELIVAAHVGAPPEPPAPRMASGKASGKSSIT